MKFKKRYLFPALFIGGIALGPRPGFSPIIPQEVQLDIPLEEVSNYVDQQEKEETLLKENNQARIIWADSVRKTPYAIVYLHGFSASPMEANPFHVELAQRYGANLFLARIAGHGIDSKESFADLTPNQMVKSAEEALAIGKILGEKVILMSCSTGGTLSVFLAANYPDDVHAMLMYSPNIALANASAALLTMPWGKQLLHQIQGEYRDIVGMKKTPAEQYWTTTYRSVGLIALKSLMDQTMTDENFAKVVQPFLLSYYYKNEEEQDHVVSVDAMLDFFEKTNTPTEQKLKVPIAEGSHVLVSSFHNNPGFSTVEQMTNQFLEEVIGLTPK